MNFFKDCNTVAEVKSLYRTLARKHHPDLGGDPEVMKQLNNEYEKALRRCDGQESIGSDGKTHTYHYNEAVEQEIIEAIDAFLRLNMQGVDITLIGLWIWLTGETKPHKESLKELKCRWHSGRACWYFRPESLGYTGRYSKGSLEDLADKYGATDCASFKKKPKSKGKSRKQISA